MLAYIEENRVHRDLPQDSIDAALARLARWDEKQDGEPIYAIKADLKETMEKYCGVYRDDATLAEGVDKVKAIETRLQNAVISDHSKVFNTARIEALELENLMDVALATVISAHARQESRGAHSRVDFPERDDKNWLKHSLYLKQDYRIDFKPVHLKPLSVDSFPPKQRVY
jgi:succinate dehydrogenase / fumarate reductase flavoprotein subunit